MSSLNVDAKQGENLSILHTKKEKTHLDNTHFEKNKCNTLSFPEVFTKISGKILLSTSTSSLPETCGVKFLQNTCEGFYF